MKQFMFFLLLCFSPICVAESFYKFVPSTSLYVACDAEPQDERGPFGITLKEKVKIHDFLVMTGVYYDTCKELENKVNRLKKKYSYLLLIGTEGHIENPRNRVWRWRSIRSPRGDECISYFWDDCPHN